MSLYTKKQGKFIELDKAQIRRLRGLEQRKTLQDAAIAADIALRGFVLWLNSIEERHNVLLKSDLIVAHKPSRDALLRVANDLRSASTQLDKV